MIDGLKPYDEYDDFGLSWSGKLPAHWNVERGKWLFRKVQRDLSPEDEVVTCFRDGTVTLRENRRVRGFTESIKEIGYQGIRKGDLVIHAMDAFAGAVGVSDSDGKGSPVYSVCLPKRDANSHYYAHVVREMARTQWVFALAKGVRERSTDFRFHTFAGQFLPVPPSAEQAAIVRYLDHADRRIRRYIRVKRQLIALLHEQKQAIIHRAVTRGLDPHVKLKPSGAEWLGEVPEHWDVKRAKYLFREVDERSTTGSEELLSVSHKTGVTPRKKNVTMFLAQSNIGHKICRPGDLAINTMWAYMAALGISRQIGIVSPSYGVYRPRDSSQFVPEYVDHLLRVEGYKSEYLCRSTGITSSRLRLYPEDFLRVPIVIPPLAEQSAIVLHVESEAKEIQSAINRTEVEIELLRDYRTRLIADVVTGKLDVREAAAALPDELEAVDSDAEDLLDEDDTTDDVELDTEPEEVEA